MAWPSVAPPCSDHLRKRIESISGEEHFTCRGELVCGASQIPHKFAVYLHDTPRRSLFKETTRDFSHGCIRTEKPMDLALYLLKEDHRWTRERLVEIMGAGKRTVVKLQNPIPVHLQYWTAWVDDEGLLDFQKDIYDRDRPLDRALKERPHAG